MRDGRMRRWAGPLCLALGALALPAVVARGQIAMRAQAIEPPRKVPFAGQAIPEPPEQHAPWTPPTTRLPRFLGTATRLLFEQGMADPRGCAYREVEFTLPWIRKGRGFVLPERAEVPGRFAVAWDGQVYPLAAVGGPVDLAADIRDLAARIKQDRATRQGREPGIFGLPPWGFAAQGDDWMDSSGASDRSPLKLCLLLRLGHADLAEELFAAGTTWTPEPRARDLTNYGINYLSLAEDWLQAAFGRLIAAHTNGDDVVALDTARKLARFRDSTIKQAEAMGFPRPQGRGWNRFGNEATTWYYYLGQLDELLRDHERRAKPGSRGPVPRRGGDPAARVAALIRDLDQIDERQMSVPGGANPASSPRVAELAAEGDAAVGPLLDALANDDRLTRSADLGRGGSLDRYVHPVVEVEFAALNRILQTAEFSKHSMANWASITPAARKELAGSIRAFWEKNRAVPLLDRWYQALADDKAGAARWVEAANGIVAADVPPGRPRAEPGTQPMRGEPLRQGRTPSVTALLGRRIGDVGREAAPTGIYPSGLANARALATDLALWDAPAALPHLRELIRRCRAESDAWRNQPGQGSADQTWAGTIARFTELRLQQGDQSALEDYAAWLRTTSPKMLEYNTMEAFKPLIAHREAPVVAEAARWLFNDPASSWAPLRPDPLGPRELHFRNLYASPLIAVAGFRAGVIAALGDKTPAGSVEQADRQIVTRDVGGATLLIGGDAASASDEPRGPGRHPFRVADQIALKLSRLEGAPRVDLFWPEARRDEAIAASIDFLKRHADRFTATAPPGTHDFPDQAGHLAFPALDRPATAEDVAAARAIFTLAGEGGEVRRVELPPYPLAARWTTLRDTPVDRTYFPGNQTRREYDTDGHVWQAEEVRKGDHWERYYGFVGHHVIARAPAAEVEFRSQSFQWWNLPGGLDARAQVVGPAPAEVDPGQPVTVTLALRNRLGVAHAAPTDFLRPDPDGLPALRDGIELELWRSKTEPEGSSGLRSSVPSPTPVAAKRSAHFTPGDATRPLEPLAEFEVLRLNLGDWFDLGKPGSYRLRIKIGAGPGIGAGAASEAYFRVRGDEGD